MEWNKQTVKSLLLVVCGGLAFYCALQHLTVVAGAVAWLAGILSPFLVGGAIAFVLNVPMRAIERHLSLRGKRSVKLRRPLALVLTLMAVAAVLTLASSVIGPGVRDAVKSIASQAPSAFERLQEQLTELEQYLPQLQDLLEGLAIDWKSLSQKAISMAQSWGGSLISSGSGLIGGVVSGVSTFVIGLIFSFYILLQKEKLSRQGRQVLYALLPEQNADRALDILRLANRTFSSFLSGQCLEAVILGSMFVVAMTLCRLPYALLVGVLISLTALIPIVGAFIGCGVGALLIAVSDPWKALFFIILFLVLQQVEGNLIYPHVVGSSVGLPSIWVLAAVTLGGKLMGVAGMLFFIPLCSVLYALFRDFIKRRLGEKRVPVRKWRDSPPDIKQK
ncbi:AI-2E family transporter [uncultured Dysosmobacter sp.]|uniref:AI-2E family transporter n=1 Tax=uncultured Dysosmobacter sp. TaxID=2591384 RepID=UPI002612E906|nr:AI-2E family transporter [uncultured Dysosmobacter sp.]